MSRAYWERVTQNTLSRRQFALLKQLEYYGCKDIDEVQLVRNINAIFKDEERNLTPSERIDIENQDEFNSSYFLREYPMDRVPYSYRANGIQNFLSKFSRVFRRE